MSNPKPKQPLVARLGFFVLGGVASTVINKNLLNLAQDHFHWPLWAGYAFSVVATSVIFFLWSYYVNFRTSLVWKNCLGRYIATVLLAQVINYLIGLCGLKQFGTKGLVAYLVIGCVQSFTGGIKFLLYHFWVFPHADGPVVIDERQVARVAAAKPPREDVFETNPALNRVRRAVQQASDTAASAEWALWGFILAATIGIRIYLIHLLPVGLWSKDAGSYAYSAFRWLRTGHWETDPRRGPVYSLLIAFCGKVWGSVYSIMMLQHVMGVTAILLSVFALRLLHGRRALIPLAVCGYAYGVYGLPVYLEHLVRNETILFFCGSVSLVTWLFAIRWRQWHWLWITGAAAAILSATKNVWLPFPVLFAVATLWYYRKDMRAAVTQVLIFAIAFAVPYMGAKVFKQRTLGLDHSDEPQEGVLLYGRTAQFTDLDGGIEPEIKKQIAPQVLAYEKEVAEKKRLNNNEILKKTVVPHLTSILRKEGKTGEDLNRLCRALAIEAIRTHPLKYAEQVLRDMVNMNLKNGVRYSAPDDKEADSQVKLLKELKTPDPMIHVQESVAKLNAISATAQENGVDDSKKARRQKGRFAFFRRLELSAWMFDLAPVLLTTLLLPLVFFLSPVTTRAWWLGGAGLWYFTIVLLSTVGRPLDRYLIPALPVMFFTLSSALIMGWNALAGTRDPSSATPGSSAD